MVVSISKSGATCIVILNHHQRRRGASHSSLGPDDLLSRSTCMINALPTAAGLASRTSPLQRFALGMSATDYHHPDLLYINFEKMSAAKHANGSQYSPSVLW